MKALVASFLILLAGKANAEWTTLDTALELSFTTTALVDWSQTTWGQSLRDEYGNRRFHEENPLLGRYPSQSEINLYFVGCTVGHTLVSYFLPKPYRTIWQSLTISVELYSIQANIRGHVGLAFPW